MEEVLICHYFATSYAYAEICCALTVIHGIHIRYDKLYIVIRVSYMDDCINVIVCLICSKMPFNSWP